MKRNQCPYHQLLLDLPTELQRAVQEAVARCQPAFRPRLYASDWHEELYHEAVVGAVEAQATYDPAKGSLYAWGLRVITQRLAKFCERVWRASRNESSWLCDEDTGEAIEVEDVGAFEAIEEQVLCGQVGEALEQLSEGDRALLEWSIGEGLSERVIGERLGCSHVVVHRRLHRAWERLCEMLGVEVPFPKGWRGCKGKEKRRKSEGRG